MTDPEFTEVVARPAMTPEQSALLAAYDKWPTPRPEPERDGWGRYKLRHPTSGQVKGFTRTTTLVKAIDDTYNLQRWAMGLAALGTATHPQIAKQILALPDPADADKQTLRNLADEAKELVGGSVAASVGTALHAFTEHHDLGTDVVAPAPYDKDIAAYVKALADAGIEAPARYVERIVCHVELGCAGTLDRIVVMPDGTKRILDVKTGATLDFGWVSIAGQLAVYAGAGFILDDEGAWRKMPKVDQAKALVAHVPAGQGRCDLYEVDIAKGREIAQLCWQVREARKLKGKLDRLLLGVGPDHPTDEERAESVEQAAADAMDPQGAVERDLLWPEITDKDLARRGKQMKQDNPERVDEFREQWKATGIALKPPWTPIERDTIMRLMYPAFTPGDADPELVAQREREKANQAALAPSEPPPLPVPVDTGEAGDYPEVKSLFADLKTTAPDQAEILAMWLKEATRLDRPWKGADGAITKRHEEIACAALGILGNVTTTKATRGKKAGGPSIHQLAAHLVDYACGTDLAGHYPVGAILGSLDQAQAAELTQVAWQWKDNEPLRKAVTEAATTQETT